MVFAAASLGRVTDSLAHRFEAEHGVPVTVNLGASSTLARQIVAGAPADVFLTAHADWADYLAVNGLTSGEAVPLATNRLVAIGRRRAVLAPVFRPADLIAVPRLAVGDPAHVPLGIYTRTAMETNGVWLGVRARIVPLPDARAVVAALERGAVDAAVVYQTDAEAALQGLARDSLRRLFTWPEAEHPPIEYLAVPIADTPAAAAFARFAADPAQRDVWDAFGFGPAPVPEEPEPPADAPGAQATDTSGGS